MIKHLSISLCLLAQISYAQDAKLSGNRLKVSKVSKEALSIAKGIDADKKAKVAVTIEKTVTQEGFTKFLQKNAWITDLTVAYGNENIGSLEGAEKLKELKSITLKSLKKSKETPIDLGPLLGQKKLEKINFYATKVSNTDALKKCAALKEISFYMSNVSSIEFLRKTPLVEELDLYGFGHTFENYDALKKLKNLKDLNVYMNKQAVDENLQALEALTSLQTFSFANCKEITTLNFLKNCKGLKSIEGKWAKGIKDISVLKHLPNLEEIEITDCVVSDFSILKNCKKLKEVDISGTKIENIDFAKNLNQLEELDISETNVKSFSVINGHATLKRLNIAKTLVKDVNDAASLPLLNYINVKDCPITDLKPILNCPKLRTIKLDKKVHAKFIEENKDRKPRISMY